MEEDPGEEVVSDLTFKSGSFGNDQQMPRRNFVISKVTPGESENNGLVCLEHRDE